jgi:sporulation protein YlmC with PRC-barrel domain
MEAMRAGTEGGSFIPIKVEEACSINSKVLGSWTNHTIWLGNFQSKLRVVGSTDNEGIVNSRGIVTMVVSDTELDTSKLVISNLKVMEANVTDLFGNGTVSSILPTGEVVEVGGDGGVLPEWIRLALGCIIMIILDILAWELSWDHVMEDTETIPSAGVSRVVSELTDSFVLWADIGVCMWSNGVDLQIVPVTITV